MSDDRDKLSREIKDKLREQTRRLHKLMWLRALESAETYGFDPKGIEDALRFTAQLIRDGEDVRPPVEALDLLADYIAGTGPRKYQGAVLKSIIVSLAKNQYKELRGQGLKSEEAYYVLSQQANVSVDTIKDWLFRPGKRRRQRVGKKAKSPR